MTREPLGSLETVDLREYWQREDRDFTPWLADERNIESLGETLGLNLRANEQEVQVGPFRADILAEDLGDNVPVIIENQLERTDHGHLGALLTYAAGLEAGHVVWIASRFVEEHRAALDWLNRMTGEEVNFFGVEVQLWRIGDSAMAPKFNLVSKPNAWSKSVTAARRRGSGVHSPVYADFFEFWSGFSDYLAAQHLPLKPPKPAARNWVEIGGTPPGVRVTVSYASASRQTRLYVLVRHKDNPDRYSFLEERSALIAERTGQDFDWHPQPDRGGGWFGWAGPVKEDVVADPGTHYAWLTERLVPVIEVLNELLRDFDDEVETGGDKSGGT